MARKLLLSSLFLVFIKHDEGSLEVNSIVNGHSGGGGSILLLLYTVLPGFHVVVTDS